MAVMYPLREKWAASATSITITPPAGRALLIHDVEVVAATAGWATLKSGLVTVGFFEIGPLVRNHLQPSWVSGGYPSLLKQAKEKGLFIGYPVVEGDSFVVSTSVTATYIRVLYEEVEAGDIKGTEQDGKAADERFTVFYGTNSADISAATYAALDKSLMPSEFKAWPFELDVPPGYKITIFGLVFLEVERNSYTGSVDTYIRTSRVRVKINREALWHPDEDGFLVLGDGAAAGSDNTVYGGGNNVLPYIGEPYTGKLFWLPEPKELVAGDEVVTEVAYTLDANAVLAAEAVRMAYITKIAKG